MADSLRRFVFDNLDARGAIVRLEDSCEAIQATHHYPPGLARLLNEFAAAVCLLRDSIKVDASVTLQLRGGGAVDLIMADSMVDRRIRAIAEYDHELLPAGEQLALDAFAGDAVLAITITPVDGERYQGIVPIEHSSLAACLEDYFARSEQLPTWFRLLANTERALGIAIHALPSKRVTDPEATREHFARLQMLLNTLHVDEALTLGIEEILRRLFHEESCRLFDAREISFGCECTAEKSLNAIVSLGESEVLQLLAEHRQDGSQSLVVDCHFCFQRYEFSLSEVESVIAS